MTKTIIAMLLLSLAGCARDTGTPPEPKTKALTLKGSDTMVILGQRWAEDFMKADPSRKVQVTGGGSGTGIAALINGSTDLAMSSRSMKDAEKKQISAKGSEVVETTVARDGVTFYVHETNPITALSVEQLKKIYMGDITRWSELGGADENIVVYSRENSSGTYVFVKDEVLSGEDFTSRALTLPGTAAVVNAVSLEPFGIGFGGAAYAKGVHELKIKVGDREVAPTLANVQAGTYPLSRGLFIYTRGAPTGDGKAFIDYALSTEGQAIVTDVGYFPVK